MDSSCVGGREAATFHRRSSISCTFSQEQTLKVMPAMSGWKQRILDSSSSLVTKPCDLEQVTLSVLALLSRVEIHIRSFPVPIFSYAFCDEIISTLLLLYSTNIYSMPTKRQH